MSILHWLGLLAGCLSFDLHIFVLSTQAAFIREGNIPNLEKGRKLAGLVTIGMTAKQVKMIFGPNQPLILSSGPIVEGQYWYLKFGSIIFFDVDGKVIAVEHKPPQNNPRQGQR